MKVTIGPYTNWIGPYQIAEALCWWAKPVKDEHGFKSKPHWIHDFGTWLAEKSDGTDTVLTRICQWIESKKSRQVHVKIDKYDTWSMDHTLSYIITPMLVQLQATKHGAPFVADEDVPEHLKSTSAPPTENSWDTDDNHFLRWDWVLGEMIFAFESKIDDSWEDQFFSGESDTKFVPVDNDGIVAYEMQSGPNDTFKIDKEGRNAYLARIQRGFILFGKYYQNLWD